MKMTAGRFVKVLKAPLTLCDDLREKGESGIIIFTSGTSGKSKASVLSAGRLLEKYKTAKRNRCVRSFF